MAKKAKIPNAWLDQAITAMEPGISAGKTRRRKVSTIKNLGISEKDLKKAAKDMGWKLAQMGDDYVFTPGNYSIRPIS